ncbi:uncharacterized protein DFP93_11938 [Aneurinibacillus soli]|uniref:Uncharacterized protein n=1 Tax=Aneurinibacillus soli TaxID=1500254 RepID=A0A0U5BMW7_9BACL|nr:DUF418 domain-containing protein [Aneurinibacillus soli]PYE59114.1 uncharacterized protein DFP93_11938 [Aneurinibacillus soli]BAU29534.1 hypothetical protein CB4_03734 [Aneurinibacillus soli]
MEATATSKNERLFSLDSIRGFALLGIFLVNMPAFHSPDFIRQLYTLPEHLSPLDQEIRLFFDLFIQTKFYTIFSFLFGLGFYIFMNRAEQRGNNMYKLFSRRLCILLVFGLAHLIFLWFGDILHLYALVGFLLILFYKRSNATILGWAFGLLILYYGLFSLQLLIDPASLLASQKAGAKKLVEAVRMYQDASYTEWLAYRINTEVLYILDGVLLQIPAILPLFLFGLYAGRRRIFQEPARNQTFVKRVWAVSFLLSVPFTIWAALVHTGFFGGTTQPFLQDLTISLNGLPLCFFYMSSLVLLLDKQRWQKWLRPLGFTGQMALTNYLMQTVLSLAIIFGFGLFNRMSLTAGLLLCLVLYAGEVWFSSFWLRRFYFGPAEWLWRTLTYGQIQPFRRPHVIGEEKAERT